MQPLSSRSTWYFKFAIPSAMFCGTCAFTFDREAPLSGALAFAATFFVVTWLSLPLKNVTIYANQFRIGNFLSEIDVPLSHLVRVTGHPWVRPRSVSLRFSPPTKWGPTIRVIAPIENYTWALKELNTILENNSVPNQSTDPTFASGTLPAGQASRHR